MAADDALVNTSPMPFPCRIIGLVLIGPGRNQKWQQMTQNMKTKKLNYLAAIGVAICLGHSVLAQPAGQTNYFWSAAGDAVTWSQGANWVGGIVPPTYGTTFQINLYDAPATGSLIPITISNTDVVSINDAIFGPLWGQTLDIYGSVTCGFGEFTWGDLNAGVTTLNVHTNATLSLHDTLALGTAWWFPSGPNVVMNVYSNAQVGVNWLQFGAKMNLYGGTVSVTNGLNTGTATTPVFGGGLDSDATRAINLEAGGTLVLPASYTATVNDWISRGILRVYGVPGDASEIVISETNANWPGRTVVTTTATNANPIVAVRIQVPRTNLSVGGLEQAQVFADYAITTNVNVTTTSGIGIIYQSSATNVATVTAGGMVRATGVGSTTVKAVIGTLSNSVLVTVNAYTNMARLIHRYSFNDSPDSTTVADSIPGNSPDWDGTLVYAVTLTGSQIVLDSYNYGWVQLPAGILTTNMDAVTIETWASFGTISNWAVLFTFGDSDGTFGHNYISCQPHTGAATAQTGIKNASSEQNPFFTPVLDNYTNVHIVAVYHPEAGYCSIYTNGVLAAINSSITITMADALSTGDPYNYIGRSQYSADPYLNAYIDEFRIYKGPLTAGQIKADAALGPNQLIGTSTNVSLTATLSGSSLVIKWPTTSALVSLMSSPVLGSGAVWTQVGTVPTVVGGNYQVTIPATSSVQFYRLQQ
jgi:hypothetical protein